MNPDESIPTSHQDPRVAPDERNYNLIFDLIFGHLKKGKSGEDILLLTKRFTQNLLSDTEFDKTMMWVFDREEYYTKDPQKYGYRLLYRTFQAISYDWTFQSAFKQLGITAPVNHPSPENAYVILQIFASIQCLKIVKEFRKVQKRNELIVTIGFFLASSLLLAFCVWLTVFLANAGGVVFLTIIGAFFGLLGMFYTLRIFIKRQWLIRKYSRKRGLDGDI